MHTNFNCKAVETTEKSIPRGQVARIIDGDDELKNTMSPKLAASA